MKNNLLFILNDIYQNMQDKYLKYLILSLFNAIKDNKVDKLDLMYLDLFNYDIIKNEYYNIRDMIDIIVEYFDINKYNDIINIIRINNGLGYDNNYLTKLYKDLVKKNDYNKLNNRFKGLFNLLNDNNLIYNNIGLRILIIKYLLSIDISKLNVYQLSNNRLNDKYSFIVYKNDKVKFYSKLYFIDNDIILSTLQHDNISNVVFTLKDNINYFYGGNNETYNIEQSIDNLKDYQKKYIDKEQLYLDNIAKIEKIINFRYNTKSKNIYLSYDNIINSLFIDIYKNDMLYQLYLDIEQYKKDNDMFKSNALDNDLIIKQESLDYYKYEIDLRDYFINP